MQTLYKAKVIETFTRTIVIEVCASSEDEANALAIRQARNTREADWNHTWQPIISTSELAPSN